MLAGAISCAELLGGAGGNGPAFHHQKPAEVVSVKPSVLPVTWPMASSVCRLSQFTTVPGFRKNATEFELAQGETVPEPPPDPGLIETAVGSSKRASVPAPVFALVNRPRI